MKKNSPCAVRTKNKMAQSVKSLMNVKSFDKITVSDITQGCGVHRQTFYYHFQDRYELIEWIIYNELLVPFMDGFNLDNMYDKFRNLLEKIEGEKRFYQMAMKISSGEVSNYLSTAARELFIDVIHSIEDESELDRRSNEEDLIIVEFFGYGLSGIVTSWVQRGMKETPDELTEKLINLVNICKKLALKN